MRVPIRRVTESGQICRLISSIPGPLRKSAYLERSGSESGADRIFFEKFSYTAFPPVAKFRGAINVISNNRSG